ncbi:MAG: GntR family transcriptional regulator [Geminicoccaceae bacterium]
MKPIGPPPNRSELAYRAIVDEICDGGLPAGSRLVQEQLAEHLNVSRQPIQQAMARLEADGIAVRTGRRGLCVAPLDIERMRQHYDLRAALDGLAAGNAARRAACDPHHASACRDRGDELLAQGERAVASASINAQIRADEDFHKAVYGFSGNPLIERSAEPHWLFLRRAMGDVLRHAASSTAIWQQHAAILDAICAGDPDLATDRAVEHVRAASEQLALVLGGNAS